MSTKGGEQSSINDMDVNTITKEQLLNKILRYVGICSIYVVNCSVILPIQSVTKIPNEVFKSELGLASERSVKFASMEKYCVFLVSFFFKKSAKHECS